MPLDHRTQQPRPSKAHDHSYRPAAASDWTDPDPKTVGSALDDLHQLLYETVHAGALEAISVVDEGGINVSWGAGKVYTPDRVIQETDASDGPQACTDNAINYLVWLAGAGSTLVLQTSVGDPATDICLGHIKVQDGDIWEVHVEPIITAIVPALQAGLAAILPKIVSAGLLVSEDADATNPLDVSVEAGTYWHDAHDMHEVAQFDTRTANTLIRCYIDGSGPETWDFASGQHSIDVANWNSGTALVGTSVGKYYRGMFLVSEDNVFWIYAQEEHTTVAQAIGGDNPSVPAGLACFPASIAYIYKHGDAAFDTAGSSRWIDVRPTIGVSVPGSVSGDVVGPGAATIDLIALFGDTTGKLIKAAEVLLHNVAPGFNNFSVGSDILLYLVRDTGKGDYILIKNGTNEAILQTQGSGTDVNLQLTPKGAGVIDAQKGVKIAGPAGVGRKDHGTISSSPLALNFLEGQMHTVTLGINLTINFGTAPLIPTTGMAVLYLKITQGAGTAYTVTFGSVDGWHAQETFVMSTGLGDIDIIMFMYDGTNYWAVPMGQNFG